MLLTSSITATSHDHHCLRMRMRMRGAALVIACAAHEGPPHHTMTIIMLLTSISSVSPSSPFSPIFFVSHHVMLLPLLSLTCSSEDNAAPKPASMCSSYYHTSVQHQFLNTPHTYHYISSLSSCQYDDAGPSKQHH